MKISIYLRKSRADEEIEKKFGEGETLQRHRNILLKFSKENNYDILTIHEEIVSGESLVHRPEMLELLKEVEHNMYDAVLVMDIDRLGRGNMQEQGLILETFKKSDTKIITPRKTYDLNNDFDEEYSEFEAFMSRKELKIINRRLQRGRILSVEEGNYIGTVAPFGYLKKDGTLIPHPEQADIVKMIFKIYTTKNIGTGTIAKELNKLGLKTYTGKRWTLNAVTNILNNPVYCGKICWKKKRSEKSTLPGKRRVVFLQDKANWIIVQGRHEALIDEETFERAKQIKESKMLVPANKVKPFKNCLAGILVCGKCGFKMQRRPYKNQREHILCYNELCDSKSTRFELVEKRLLEDLEKWLKNFENKNSKKIVKNDSIELYEKGIKKLEKELKNLSLQKNKLHDFLEQGVYDIQTFLYRSQNIADRIDITNKNISELEQKIISESKEKDIKAKINAFRIVLDIYPTLTDALEKNLMLKSILKRVKYYKSKEQIGKDFRLEIEPKV